MTQVQSPVKETKGKRRKDPYIAIVESAKKSASVTSFFQDVLRTITGSFAAPYGLIYVEDNSQVIEYDWHTGSDDPKLWKSIVHQFLTDSLEKKDAAARILNSKSSAVKAALLSAPIFNAQGTTIGAIALLAVPIKQEEIVSALTSLKTFATLASYAAQLKNASVDKHSEQSSQTSDYRGLSKSARFSTAEELAFAITNNLRTQFECEQVAIGIVQQPNVKILSISGMDSIIKRNPGIIPLLASMEECLDAAEIIVSQEDESVYDEQQRTYYLHRQWRAFAKGDAVASIPLRFEDKIVAILSLRRLADRPFTVEELEDIERKVSQFVPGLILLQRANRNLIRHIKDSANNAVEWFKTPGRYKSKSAVAVAVIASFWFMFGSMSYHIAVPCTVEPAVVRHISAPTNAVLASVFCVAGDKVKRGDILCELDHRNLDDQLEKVQAEIAVFDHQIDKYLAKNDAVNVRLIQAKKTLAQTKLKIIRNRISQAIIRAPIDGVIISGDLRKQVGSVLSKGTSLFEVASSHKMTIKAQVPESEIDELRTNLAGIFVPYAQPSKSLNMKVTRIYPRAQIVNGKNVYIVEAQVNANDDWIKPGMDGSASINVGKRRVYWIALHRVIDYLRYKLGL